MKIQMATLVAAVAFTGVASAGVIVDTSSANDRATFSPADATAANAATQTFTTGVLGAETNLVSIELEGPRDNPDGAADNILTLQVWTDADNNAATHGLGVLLGTSTNSGAVGLSSQDFSGTFTYTFSGVTLADNTAYAFIVVDGAGNAQQARWGLTNVNDLADGTLFVNGAEQFGGNFDSSMQIITNVPEPGSLALLGLGGLAMLRRRRA